MLSAEKVMNANIINFKYGVTDLPNVKKGKWAFYTNETVN